MWAIVITGPTFTHTMQYQFEKGDSNSLPVIFLEIGSSYTYLKKFFSKACVLYYNIST